MLLHLFVYSSINGHLGGFQFWALINKTAVYFHVQMFVWPYAFIFVGCVPKSGMVVLHGRCMCNLLQKSSL